MNSWGKNERQILVCSLDSLARLAQRQVESSQPAGCSAVLSWMKRMSVLFDGRRSLTFNSFRSPNCVEYIRPTKKQKCKQMTLERKNRNKRSSKRVQLVGNIQKLTPFLYYLSIEKERDREVSELYIHSEWSNLTGHSDQPNIDQSGPELDHWANFHRTRRGRPGIQASWTLTARQVLSLPPFIPSTMFHPRHHKSTPHHTFKLVVSWIYNKDKDSILRRRTTGRTDGHSAPTLPFPTH